MRFFNVFDEVFDNLVNHRVGRMRLVYGWWVSAVIIERILKPTMQSRCDIEGGITLRWGVDTDISTHSSEIILYGLTYLKWGVDARAVVVDGRRRGRPRRFRRDERRGSDCVGLRFGDGALGEVDDIRTVPFRWRCDGDVVGQGEDLVREVRPVVKRVERRRVDDRRRPRLVRRVRGRGRRFEHVGARRIVPRGHV